MAVGMTEGGRAMVTSVGARKRRTNRQSSFGPTCRLVSSPEVGLGATVGTLKQGYPLLQCEDVVPVRLPLVVWQTTLYPATWMAPGSPRGQGRRYTPRYQQWFWTPMGKCRTPTRPLGRVRDPHGRDPDPRGGSRTPLCGIQAAHSRVLGLWDREYPDLAQAGVRC
jgi:hypothetical protein